MGDPVYKAAAYGKIAEFDKKAHQLGITGDEQDQIHSASIPPTEDSLESGPGA